MGDILEGTFTVLRRYPAATLGSSAVVVGVVSLVQLLITVPLVGSFAPVVDAAEVGDPALLAAEIDAVSWGALAAGGALVGMLSVALFVLLSGLLAIVVGQSAVGKPLGFAQAWRLALPRLPRLLVGMLLVTLVVSAVWVVMALLWGVAVWADSGFGYLLVGLLTLFVAVPATIFLSIKLALTTPALALESTEHGPIGPAAALRRSWGLVRGAWWRTLGILLLAAVIAGTLSQVIAVPLGVVVSALPLSATGALVGASLAAALGQAVTQPITGLVLGLVYVDRRIRAEQLDAALARAAGLEPQ